MQKDWRDMTITKNNKRNLLKSKIGKIVFCLENLDHYCCCPFCQGCEEPYITKHRLNSISGSTARVSTEVAHITGRNWEEFNVSQVYTTKREAEKELKKMLKDINESRNRKKDS